MPIFPRLEFVSEKLILPTVRYESTVMVRSSKLLTLRRHAKASQSCGGKFDESRTGLLGLQVARSSAFGDGGWTTPTELLSALLTPAK